VALESDVTILGNLAIALSFVVALAFGILQVRANNRDRHERLTLETIRTFQTREFATHLQRLRNLDTPTTYAAMQALPADEQVSFIHFAQEMEMLGLLVADGTLALDLVERTLGDFVTFAWAQYRPFIEDGRTVLKDPYLEEYFQWLAERLERQMRNRPRRPAYASP
jgi:hypothetical protein